MGATARGDVATGARAPRTYEKWDGANRFFLRGRLVSSGDNPLVLLIFSVVLLVLPPLWMGWEARYLWNHVSPAPVVLMAYFYLNAVASLFVTAFRDPGILPRGVDPDPEREPRQAQGVFDIEAPIAPPKDLWLPVERFEHGGAPELGLHTSVRSKWCATCKMYRPPRASHCRACDDCMDTIDHHCVFLNTCIARRNYAPFIALLSQILAMQIIGIIGCAMHLYYLSDPRNPGQAGPTAHKNPSKPAFVRALQAAPQAAVFFWLACVSSIPVLCLWTYHLWLLAQNHTTVEQIRIGSGSELYDVQTHDVGCTDATRIGRACARLCARVRSVFVTSEFAPPPPAEREKRAGSGLRRRTPFQRHSALGNAVAVLGRAVPAPYVPWTQPAGAAYAPVPSEVFADAADTAQHSAGTGQRDEGVTP